MKQAPYKHIAIVGLGLIGGSLAAACSRCFENLVVAGVDVDASACATALENAWVDEAFGPESPEWQRYVVEKADLVVLAVAAERVVDYLASLENLGFTGTITDTASTKTLICQAAESILSQPGRFVPGHPMSGSEVNGIAGARADLFDGAHWILCPDQNTDPERYTDLHEFLLQLNARVVSLPRQDHDKAVAVVSHVPHFVAASLVELAARHADNQQSLFRLAAGGFKDSTRIAAGSPALWCGIAFDNKDAVSGGLSEMRDIIGQFQQALDSDNRSALLSLLEDCAAVRRGLPAQWVPSTDSLLEVRIPMENRSGVVAEVTTVASQVGCNIQSIEIDHVTADSAVLSMVLTDEGDIGKLSTQLIEKGFSISFSPLSAKEYTHVE